MTDEKQQPIIQIYDPEAKTEKAIAKVKDAIEILRTQQKIISYKIVDGVGKQKHVWIKGWIRE
ncbi:hypothetical protein HZA40_03725 [Candidatus Peregrinibacteria bacterium]|nr:hypothetical protein [Candidatus Peregrinibacteria bacterium]